MNIIEQRFMESVPSTLHDIAKSLETIAKQKEEPKPQTVWVFCADQVCDDDVFDVIMEVFSTEDAALNHLHEFVHGDDGELAYAKKRGWTVEYDEPNHFKSYEDGYYSGNHTECTVEERRLRTV